LPRQFFCTSPLKKPFFVGFGGTLFLDGRRFLCHNERKKLKKKGRVEMTARSHAVLLAFAVVFAMGMALAVAILCIPAVSEKPPIEETTATGGVAATESDAVLESTGEPVPILPDVSNGLQFTSFGNGTCALTGIGICADACVVIPEFSPFGDRVVEIAPRALYGVPSVTAIQIPASVRVIGEYAFAACKSLMYISVSAQNPCFCDLEGVLYTADRSVLLAYPAMRAGECAELGIATKKIADMAFFGCVYLKSICYQGSPEEWESISVGAKNYSLIAASKAFLGAESR
jgi:hypothetical protein